MVMLALETRRFLSVSGGGQRNSIPKSSKMGFAPIDGSIIVNAIPMTLESFFSDQGFVYTI